MSYPSKKILGVRVSSANYVQIIRTLFAKQPQKCRYISVAAVHLIMECQRNKSLRQGVNKSLFVTPDGMPLVWLLHHYGLRQASRVYGPTLMLKVCQEAERKGKTIFLLGGATGQTKALIKKLRSRFPKLKIVCAIETPVRPLPVKTNTKVISQINKLKPDVIFVGLGCPYQEQWIITNHKKINQGILIGVGAAFDFHSGRVKQAPPLLQNIGLEWLFRLSQDPKRLWYRYTVLNFHFILKILQEVLKRE